MAKKTELAPMSYMVQPLRTVNITRYITPLREGGSLPAITDADDGFMYVLKFRGAGQGPKALIAELIGGEIARALGLHVPELVFANLDVAFGRSEPDEEIQDLLQASEGLNLGLHYLEGAMTFDPAVTKVNKHLASKIVWLDCLLTNVDRTAKNTNMLLWKNEVWLIDHGASLYFHHSWSNWEKQAASAFTHIKDHVLLPQASMLEQADEQCRQLLTATVISNIIDMIPDTWLIGDAFENAQVYKSNYKSYLHTRLSNSQIFVKEAQHARQQII